MIDRLILIVNTETDTHNKQSNNFLSVLSYLYISMMGTAIAEP